MRAVRSNCLFTTKTDFIKTNSSAEFVFVGENVKHLIHEVPEFLDLWRSYYAIVVQNDDWPIDKWVRFIFEELKETNLFLRDK